MKELLGQLKASRTDLARIVEAASHSSLPHIVVLAAAVRGWEARDPTAWVQVQQWLAARGMSVVEIEGWGKTGSARLKPGWGSGRMDS